MSLENMSDEQRDRLARVADKLLGNPETDRATRRLLMQVDPTFRPADIQLEDAIKKANEDNAKEIAKLREEREADKLTIAQAEADALCTKAGFKTDDIYKIVREERVGSIPVAIELARARAQAKASSEHNVHHTDVTMRFDENFKEIQKNPAAWARKEAHKAIDELKAARGVH